MKTKKPKQPTGLQLVYVEWLDSSSYYGWQKRDKISLSVIKTVGWLIEETKQGILLSMSYTSNDNWADQLSIPRSVIQCFRKLKFMK
jgi:hypothetical protein